MHFVETRYCMCRLFLSYCIAIKIDKILRILCVIVEHKYWQLLVLECRPF
jgi:hypothetical protein